MKIPHDQLKLYIHNHFIIIHLQRRKNFSLEIILIENQNNAKRSIEKNLERIGGGGENPCNLFEHGRERMRARWTRGETMMAATVSLICIYLMIEEEFCTRRIAVGTGAVMKFERKIARAASREADISNVTWPVPSFYANKTVERLISLGVRRRRRPLRPSFKRGRCWPEAWTEFCLHFSFFLSFFTYIYIFYLFTFSPASFCLRLSRWERELRRE